jgi:phospholipase/carboxylesterase
MNLASTTMTALRRRPPRALLALATLTSSSSCRRTASSASFAPGDATIEATGTWGGLRVRTVGERRNPRQVVVLLHGWGAPGDDLVPLGEVLAAPGRLLVFPEAPLASPGGGRAWWPLDLARLQQSRTLDQQRARRRETPPGLPEARAQVTALLAEAARRTRVAPTALVVGGFSQGAMLATDVALASPGAVGALAVLSGSLIAEAEWTARLPALKPGLPVFMSHGRGDPILPFQFAEVLRDLMQGGRHPVTWVPFNGGHEIPGVVLNGLRDFLAAHGPEGAAVPDGVPATN